MRADPAYSRASLIYRNWVPILSKQNNSTKQTNAADENIMKLNELLFQLLKLFLQAELFVYLLIDLWIRIGLINRQGRIG